MSLTSAINNANSGLANAGYRAEISASNIANATTPGYVRRTVTSSELVSGGQGNGVTIDGVERLQDTGLSRLRREADSSLARNSALSHAYSQLNTELGEPGSGYGLFQAVENLEHSFASLQATPESSALQNAAVSAASELTGQFNELASYGLAMRQGAEKQIAQDVQTVNQALVRLDQINGEVASLRAASGNATPLEDERQTLLDTISEIIPVKDITRENGRIEVLTTSGIFLLSGSIHELSFEQTPVFNHQYRYDETGSLGLSGLFVGEQEITPGSSSQHAVTNGSFAGQFAIRDEVATGFTDQLDSLAADLINRFSDSTVDPSLGVNMPGLFTDAASTVDASYIVGAASRISINARLDPAQGGDPSRLRDGIESTSAGNVANGTIITNLYNTLISSSRNPIGVGDNESVSIADGMAAFTSNIGEQSLRYNAINSSVAARRDVLSNAELSASGVDTDQELQDLLIIEQAYAANARVIQTVGDMIDRLLQI